MPSVLIETAGESKSVSYTIATPPSTLTVLDGSAFNPNLGIVQPSHTVDYQQKTARFGPYNMPRPFFGPGQQLSWSAEQVACLAAGEKPVISRKIPAGGLTRTELTNFVNNVPAKFPLVFICLHHEPRTSKPDVDPAVYRSSYELLDECIAASPHKARIRVVKILMSYQLRYGGQRWQDYVVHSDGNYYCDVFGLDAYSEVWTPAAKANGGYEPPADSHNPAKLIKASTGLPIALTEVGAERQPGDESGLKQLKWFQDSLAWSQANGALWWGPWADNNDRWVWPFKDTPDPVTDWMKQKLAASRGILPKV